PNANGRRLIAKVGQRGTSRSKKWTGKLLEIPPSENQQRSGRCASGRVSSKRQSGTPLSRTGKERLIRVATTTGRSAAAGRGNRGAARSRASCASAEASPSPSSGGG